MRDADHFREELISACSHGERILCCFGRKYDGVVRVFVVYSDDANSRLHFSSMSVSEGGSFPSLSRDIPSMHVYERELYESFGIIPENHPWLKPVRYPHDRSDQKSVIENYPFYRMEGEQIHEVAVGPVHAGVIEPGHFRFMCDGENIHHLEIQLGYQHRGVESLLMKGGIETKSALIESVCGDTVIGHSTAYANALEALADIDLSRRAHAIRGIMLELERIGIHLGDLSAISGDIAYLSGNAIFGALRTYVINTSQAICGSRFGKGIIRPGGVLFDIDEELASQIRSTLGDVAKRTDEMANAMFADPGVLSRIEKTGVVDADTARQIGMTGPAARASSLRLDARADHPYGIYKFFPVFPRAMKTCDVFARAYMRYIEIQQSIDLILEILDSFPEDTDLLVEMSPLKADSIVVSICEGWRGEIVHAVMTGGDGSPARYYIKDPSMHNWTALALSVRGNGISDFPLCNKSFNLSYCGNDL
jgi:Ni,Fe-hydrogenase III large subunit